MTLNTICNACRGVDHANHSEVVQAVPEGMLGGSKCTCDGECMDGRYYSVDPQTGSFMDAVRQLPWFGERTEANSAFMVALSNPRIVGPVNQEEMESIMTLMRPVAKPVRDRSDEEMEKIDLEELKDAILALESGKAQPIGPAFYEREVQSGDRAGEKVPAATRAKGFGNKVRAALTDTYPDDFLVKGGRQGRNGEPVDTSRILVQSAQLKWEAGDTGGTGEFALLSLRDVDAPS